MNNKYFEVTNTIYDITNKYPETIDLFMSIGFETLKDEEQRKTFGKSINLKTALGLKKVNIDTFTDQLIQVIEDKKNQASVEVGTSSSIEEAKVKIEGILPCPVKLPLLEAFNGWLDNEGKALKSELQYDLKAASLGVDWLKESIENEEDTSKIPDIFLSAGFDLFFDKQLIGKFKEQGVFQDITGFEHFNKDFENEAIDLRDPNGHYSMISVVPAIFLVNTDELNGRPVPTSWKDLLSPEFENSVSLPIGDFDLFNAILLNIYKTYGEVGIRSLAKSLLKSMHPAEMVKSHKKAGSKPVVTIMPYFFTKMTKRGGPMKSVWPSDGSIISPIFLLSKKDKKEMMQPIVDFFASKEVGEILSYNGKFPSVHPEVDNMIADDHKYMWLGWDYINNNDIGALISHCMELFNKTIEE